MSKTLAGRSNTLIGAGAELLKRRRTCGTPNVVGASPKPAKPLPAESTPAALEARRDLARDVWEARERKPGRHPLWEQFPNLKALGR